jgi:hypothetical protein
MQKHDSRSLNLDAGTVELLCQMLADPQEDQASGRGASLSQAVDPSGTRSFMAE